jgi:cyclopropane-fatty-acyl-phospholipid synthase
MERNMAGTNRYKEMAKSILAVADVDVDGSDPWDIQVHDEDFYQRVFSQGTLGLGEAYMDGWWDCKRLDEFFDRVLRARLDVHLQKNWKLVSSILLARLFNRQSTGRAFQIGEKHYDLGNDLFENMLDSRLAYSCGYWNGADSLDKAQEQKLDLICRKLGLQPGMKVLDIGCGWASFLKYAAEKYGAEVVGITVSREQVEYGQEICKGLPVDIRLQDYRDVDEKFDYIVSVGMIEHVGYKNYRTYMEMAYRCLKDDGLFLLHTIGGNRSVKATDPWIDKYIFRNGMLPSIQQLGAAIEGLFIMEDWHNFSADYDTTLMSWYKNFTANWDKISSNYSDRFYRMWEYYLLSCAGSFRARSNQLWQIVLAKQGVPGGYKSIR